MIYLISTNTHIKLGFSKNPKRRLKQLQTANAEKLMLLKVFPGDKKVEKELHDLLDEYRMEGEWFLYDDDIFKTIDIYLKYNEKCNLS